MSDNHVYVDFSLTSIRKWMWRVNNGGKEAKTDTESVGKSSSKKENQE